MVSLLLSKHDNVIKNSQKNLTYILCLIKEGNDGGYMTCATNQSLTNAPKMMTSKTFISIWLDTYNAFLIHVTTRNSNLWIFKKGHHANPTIDPNMDKKMSFVLYQVEHNILLIIKPGSQCSH